jgi:Fe-S cluster biogenesis protein NfuA
LTREASPDYIVVPKEIPMLNEKVLLAIQDVRPSLQADGGDIELVSVSEDGVVNVKLTGACGSCPMSTMTLKMGVENYLKKAIPEVKEVVQV